MALASRLQGVLDAGPAINISSHKLFRISGFMAETYQRNEDLAGPILSFRLRSAHFLLHRLALRSAS